MIARHTGEYDCRPIVRTQASSIAPWKQATVPVCALVLLLALPTSAQIAQPARSLTELSLEDLMNIEVTSASKRPQPFNEVSAALFVVTQEDIRRSGATSFPDVLRMVPGLQVARINSNKWAVSARGFSGRFADKLLVLMDGRTLSGVFWDVQDTLLEDIDRIEVIRGPGATLWGANAVNGVINIITKTSEDTQGMLVVAGGGTEDRGFGTLRYGGELPAAKATTASTPNTSIAAVPKICSRELSPPTPRTCLGPDFAWTGRVQVLTHSRSRVTDTVATLERRSGRCP